MGLLQWFLNYLLNYLSNFRHFNTSCIVFCSDLSISNYTLCGAQSFNTVAKLLFASGKRGLPVLFDLSGRLAMACILTFGNTGWNYQVLHQK